MTKNNKKNKLLEVEQKFLCSDIILLEQILKEEDFIEISTEKEIDNYYSDLNGDFIKNRTCLRIRNNNNYTEITHKGKSNCFSGSFSKIEHNIQISSELISDYNDIFNSLGFVKYVTVDKIRRTFIKNTEIYNYIITIDNINGVGEFVEFEVSGNIENSNKDDAEKILNKIIEIFLPCGLEQADLPYRDYVANYLSERFLLKNKITTILFDLDGTLIPTERPFFESFKEVILEDYNEDLTIDEYNEYEMSIDSGLIKYLMLRGLNILDENSFMNKVYFKYNIKLEELLSSQKVSNDFNAVISLKKAGYKVGLVTTSRKEYVDKILSSLGNEKLFEQVVTREDVINKKPDPESYKLILSKMEELPSNCLVIEDSIRGLESARAANLNCVLVAEHTLLSKQDLINFDAPVFDNVTQISMLLLLDK
ncbi:MAG: class IV adenylate cyclase [Candidatus Nomurabacteria bacterium]|nr:class IV adenylate cyclase [Candidatus Nomurabacteria bacterium]